MLKEYRVRQQITDGPHKGIWGGVCRPDGWRMVFPFGSLQDAQDWIAKQPAWYAEYNKRWPPEMRREVPPFRIEVREVTPWETVEQ